MKIVPLTIAAALLAGCVSMPSGLSDAARRLDRSADAFSDEVYDARNMSLRREAKDFAEVAEDFNGDVQERMEREALRDRFERVAKRYHELRDEFDEERSADSRERTAFNEVTRAYLDLERELQYADRDRRNRDRSSARR